MIDLALRLARYLHAAHDACVAFAESMMDHDECDHDDDGLDLDAPQRETWIVTPQVVMTWLDQVADGRPVAEVMAEIELAEVDQ